MQNGSGPPGSTYVIFITIIRNIRYRWTWEWERWRHHWWSPPRGAAAGGARAQPPAWFCQHGMVGFESWNVAIIDIVIAEWRYGSGYKAIERHSKEIQLFRHSRSRHHIGLIALERLICHLQLPITDSLTTQSCLLPVWGIWGQQMYHIICIRCIRCITADVSQLQPMANQLALDLQSARPNIIIST